jgi:para-aminobenzoate synthetase component 1
MSNLQCAHVLKEIDTAISLIDYYSGFADDDYSFILDSGMDQEKLGRFSFAGKQPFLIFKSKGDTISILTDRERTTKQGNPLIELRHLMCQYRVDPTCYQNTEIPFLGGAVGYFGYELCYFMEKLPCLGLDDLGLPDCYFMFVDTVIIYDHLEKRMFISAVGFDEDFVMAQQKARRKFEKLRYELKRFAEKRLTERSNHSRGTSDEAEKGGGESPELEIRSMFTEEQYMEVVRQAKEHIFAGDIFEVCTTHRLECDFSGDPLELYQELRRINPAPFASYLNLPEVKVVSSSPERFLRIGRDRWCASRPIKGTRPRGKTVRENKQLYKELFSSIKDRAENTMIVDLVRNDFGRVCEVGSVQVAELMIIELYATVFQMVSTIVGKLEEGRDCFDLIQACFPGGSMTGAPKIEAMTIIDALEPVKRGIYSGSIGYLDFAGNADLNIVIRTILIKDNKAYFQVGGAVVADSDPRDEYLETLTKARALVQALKNVTQRRQRMAVPTVATLGGER